MVWAAINGRGDLILKRCPPKVKSADYQDILQKAIRFVKPRYAVDTSLWDATQPHVLQAFRGAVSTRWGCSPHITGNQDMDPVQGHPAVQQW